MNITVFCPAHDDSALALIAHARAIAPEAHITALTEEGVDAALCGGVGADDAVLIDVSEDDCVQADRIADALAALAPDAALFPATIRGRMLSAWAASKLQTGLTADCTGLSLTPDGLLRQVRPAFGGNLTAEILCRTHRPQMASVRPGVFPMPEAMSPKTIPVRRFEATVTLKARLRRLAFEANVGRVELQSARVIVAGGRGIGGKAGFEKLGILASLLGGAVGASRSAVDAGWAGYEHQVGQTGVTVRPKLYIAVGISGAVQHTAGMNGADMVLAINSDPRAPIFSYADYGVVSDWEPAVDDMIRYLQERKN